MQSKMRSRSTTIMKCPPCPGPQGGLLLQFIAFNNHKESLKCEFHSHFTDGQLRLRENTHLVNSAELGLEAGSKRKARVLCY